MKDRKGLDLMRSRIALFFVLATMAAGQTGYTLAVRGPSTVNLGYDLYLSLTPKWPAGITPTSMYFDAITLPAGVTAEFICQKGSGACWSSTAAGLKLYLWGGKNAFQLRLIAAATATTGDFIAEFKTHTSAFTEVTKIPFRVAAIPVIPAIPSSGPDGAKWKSTIAKWKSTMLSLGAKWCKPSEVIPFGYEGHVWYYDGGRVYFQVADYTGEKAKWEPCAYWIVNQYRDNVMRRTPPGGIQAWRVFTKGLSMAYRRTGDVSYKAAVVAMSKSSPYAAPQKGGILTEDGIRETAYLLEAQVEAERLGEPRNPVMAKTASLLLGHFQILFSDFTYQLHQTFYDGIGVRALIEYHDLTKDPRVLPAVKTMLDWMWFKGWDPVAKKLVYNPEPSGPKRPPESGGCQKYGTELINLIVPAFAWYYRQTGDTAYSNRGDEMWSHALDTDISYSGKIFSQNYQWSFDFLKWRQGMPPKAPANTRHSSHSR